VESVELAAQRLALLAAMAAAAADQTDRLHASLADGVVARPELRASVHSSFRPFGAQNAMNSLLRVEAGPMLRSLRLAAGWSTEELAAAIGWGGGGGIRRWELHEAGVTKMALKTMCKAVSALDHADPRWYTKTPRPGS